jgi:hypothetical protein
MDRFDLIPVMIVVLGLVALYGWHRWSVKRKRKRERENRRMEFKTLVRESTPIWDNEEERRRIADGPAGTVDEMLARMAARAAETRTLDEWLTDHGRESLPYEVLDSVERASTEPYSSLYDQERDAGE